MEVSCAKWRMLKKCSHETRFARRPDARLPYPTLTGGHQVCITRKGDPVLRLLTNRSQENHLFASSVSPTEATSTCGRTDNSEIQGLASPWDNILIPAQDATQQCCAATTRREAGFGAKGVTTNAAATIWPGRNARANFRAHTLACTTPSPRGRIRASPLSPRT